MEIEHKGKVYRIIPVSNSKYLYVETREDGRPVRFSTGCKDEGPAWDYLKEYLKDLDAPELPGGLHAVLDYYQEHHAKNLASAEQSAIAIRHLKSYIRNVETAALTKHMQRMYITDRRAAYVKEKGKELSSETINRELTVLSAAIRFYYDDNNIQFAPPRVKLLKRKQPREKWLSRSQMAELVWRLYRSGYPAEHLLMFVRLGLYSGPRPGQITSLPWARVDFDNRAIWYFDPEDEETNKRAEVVDMSDRIFTMLSRHRERQRQRAMRSARRNGEPFVEPTHVIMYKGAPVEKIHRGFKRHTLALGWDDVTPNTLRHTFATHAARHADEVNMTLMDLMKAMGHSSIKTTMRYAKHMPGRHRKVIQAARKKGK